MLDTCSRSSIKSLKGRLMTSQKYVYTVYKIPHSEWWNGMVRMVRNDVITDHRSCSISSRLSMPSMLHEVGLLDYLKYHQL